MKRVQSTSSSDSYAPTSRDAPVPGFNWRTGAPLPPTPTQHIRWQLVSPSTWTVQLDREGKSRRR